MKVSVEEPSVCRRILRIEVPKDVVDPEYDKVIKEYAEVARIPGFRKGKAPASLVESRHSKQIVEETSNRLVSKCYREALTEKQIDPVAILGVHNVSLHKGQGLQFSVEVDVPPKFKVPKYRGLSLKGNKVEVEDTRVEDALTDLRERSAKFEEVLDKQVANGDMVQIDYRGTCEGKPIKEIAPDVAALGEGTDFWTIVGETEFVPGLSAGLLGANIGDSRDVDVTFPEHYRITQVAGRSASYTVMVKAVRIKVLPEIDNAFLKNLGVDSETSLRVKLRERLLDAAHASEKRRLIGEITKKLLEKASFGVPQSLVVAETRSAVSEIVSQNTARGVPREQIEKSKDDIVKAATQSSEERVKLKFILERIADAERITVDDSEIDMRIGLLAQSYGVEKSALRRDLEKRNALANVRESLQAEKALEFVLERAKVRVK